MSEPTSLDEARIEAFPHICVYCAAKFKSRDGLERHWTQESNHDPRNQREAIARARASIRPDGA